MNLEKNMNKKKIIYIPIPQEDPTQDMEDPPPDEPQTFSAQVRPRFRVGRSRSGSLQYGTDRPSRPSRRQNLQKNILYYPGNIFFNIMNFYLCVI